MEEKHYIDSSTIKRIRYYEKEKRMVIMFTSNAEYEYSDVPKHIWEDAQAAPSIGRFVSQSIKNTYAYNRL